MSPTTDGESVMSAIDDDGTTRRLIIADLDQDDAWIAMRLDDTGGRKPTAP
ncbi:hypothetical protein ACFO0N_02935 [Halobium salinum]|uniref:Uncharacterized protein n=1 Tax=Halobium salinum TaxID=1364940 RepID=A0ABD5P8V2_9EURY|nr:hypothetical protein [Halobium salinum]